MRYNLLFPLLAFLLIPYLSGAQLSGTYTIGGVNPDFNTITLAINTLTNSGVSGPVIFNIRSGSYNEVMPTQCAPGGLSQVNTVTFQSEVLDSSQVIINNANINGYTFTLSSPFGMPSISFILKELTITNNHTTSVSSNGGIEILNCSITHGVSANFGHIQHCLVDDLHFLNHQNNPFLIEDNEITGDIYTAFTNGDILRNLIIGGVHPSSSTYGVLAGNSISGPSSWDGIVMENHFHGNADVGTQIINNVFHRNITLHDNCLMAGNEVYGQTLINRAFSGHNDDTIQNNFFYGVILFYGRYCVFRFNNCAQDPTVYMDYQGLFNVIEDNIMPTKIYWIDTATTVIHNNNFYGGWGVYDTHPIYINPQYAGPVDLHVTNPQLNGRGIQTPNVNYDIDSLNRPAPPTIGANEICISTDTLNVNCGDSIILSFCNMPTGNFLWTPAAGLNNVHLALPTLSAYTSNWYSVTDTVSGYKDSVYINVLPWFVNVSSDDSIKCGMHPVLTASFNASATYQWTPTDSLSAPASYFTEAYPSQTTTYTVTATVAGCGTYTGSVTLFIDPLPRAFASYSDSCLTITLFNYSTCATSYWWDFGDSSYSSDENPTHTYSNTGYYNVYLIVYNSFGSDTITGMIYVKDCATTFVEEITREQLTCYPNPASTEITISLTPPSLISSLEIYNLLGELVLKDNNFVPMHERKVDTTTDPRGVYILKISTGQSTLMKKIILY